MLGLIHIAENRRKRVNHPNSQRLVFKLSSHVQNVDNFFVDKIRKNIGAQDLFLLHDVGSLSIESLILLLNK